MRRADYFAQFHQGLIPVAGGLRCEEMLRGDREGAPVFRSAKVAANGFDAREHAGHVAIEYGQRNIVGDAQYGCSRVGADAREFERGVECRAGIVLCAE